MDITLEWLSEHGFETECGKCGRKGILADSDKEIFWQARFYPAGEFVDRLGRIDDRTELCMECLDEATQRCDDEMEAISLKG